MAQGEVHIDDNDQKNEFVTKLETIGSHVNAEGVPFKIPVVDEGVMQLKEFDGTR